MPGGRFKTTCDALRSEERRASHVHPTCDALGSSDDLHRFKTGGGGYFLGFKYQCVCTDKCNRKICISARSISHSGGLLVYY